MTSSKKYYSVVTFGAPAKRLNHYYLSEDAAIQAAQVAMGTGTCSCARVVACSTGKEARGADISDSREVLFSA